MLAKALRILYMVPFSEEILAVTGMFFFVDETVCIFVEDRKIRENAKRLGTIWKEVCKRQQQVSV